MTPPWLSTIHLAMASPRPEPARRHRVRCRRGRTVQRVSCGFLVHADALVLNTYVDRTRARIGRYAKRDGRSRTRVLGGILHYYAQACFTSATSMGASQRGSLTSAASKAESIRVLGIDHLRFLAYLADQCSQVSIRAPQHGAGGIARVPNRAALRAPACAGLGGEGCDRFRPARPGRLCPNGPACLRSPASPRWACAVRDSRR